MMTSTDSYRRGLANSGSHCLWLSLVVATLLLGAGSFAVRAQGEELPFDPAAANTKAIELSRQGAYVEAIDIWLSLMDRLGPEYVHRHVLHRNVGRNYQHMALLAPAAYHLRLAVALGGAQQEKAALWLFAVEEELRRTHVKVTLEAPEVGSQLVLDEGSRLRAYTLPLDWWFLPGQVRLTIRLPNGEVAQRTETVGEKETHLTLARAPEEVPAAAPPAWRLRPATWSLLGSAVAMLAVGGTTFLVARSRLADLDGEFARDYGSAPLAPPQYETVNQQWQDRVAQEVSPWEYSSYALLGSGIAVGAVGGYLLYQDLAAPGQVSRASFFFVPDAHGAVVGLTF
jgi:hypothetical protein